MKHTSTTGVPALSHPLTSLKSIRVPLPPIVEQRAIADVLDCLDAKIELNDRINATLEAFAQAIFEHWFVDFEFPNGDEEPYKSSGGEMASSELGEIPRGWDVSGVDSIADYINGKAFTAQATQRGRPIIKIAELKSGIKTTTKRYGGQAHPSNIAYFDDILFSWSASLDLFRWWGAESVINQHIFKVIPRNHFTKPFIYYTLKSVMPHFKSIASTKVTTMGHIKRYHLTDEKVVIPPKAIIKKFEETAGPFYYLIAPTSRENGILSRLRDALLPQLLSGAIEASSTQKKQSEAAPTPRTNLEQKTLPVWQDVSDLDAR